MAGQGDHDVFLTNGRMSCDPVQATHYERAYLEAVLTVLRVALNRGALESATARIEGSFPDTVLLVEASRGRGLRVLDFPLWSDELQGGPEPEDPKHLASYVITSVDEEVR
jgi:hypothetical protein